MALPELLTNSPIPGQRVPLTTLRTELKNESGVPVELEALMPPALRVSGQTRLLIGSEIILVEGTNSTTVPVIERGAEGSTKASHPIGANVYQPPTAGGFDSRYPAKNNEGRISISTIPLPLAGEVAAREAALTAETIARETQTAEAVKLTGNQTVAGTKTFSSPPVVPTPVAANDAVSLEFMQGLLEGITPYANVRLATTASLPTNTYLAGVLTGVAFGALTIDGTAPVIGQRVLVKNEATEINNGIYTVTHVGAVAEAYVLTRASDMVAGATVKTGALTYATAGSTNANKGFWVVGLGPFTVATNPLKWEQYLGSQDIVAGEGIQITGNQIAVASSVVSGSALGATAAQPASVETISAAWIFSIPLEGAGNANYRGKDHGPFNDNQIFSFGNSLPPPWGGTGEPAFAMMAWSFTQHYGSAYPGYPVGQSTQGGFNNVTYSSPTINDSAQCWGKQVLMKTSGGVNYTQTKPVVGDESDAIVREGVTTTGAVVGFDGSIQLEDGAISTGTAAEFFVFSPAASTGVSLGLRANYYSQYPGSLLESNISNYWGLYSATRIGTEDQLWVGTFGKAGYLASACAAAESTLTLLPGTINNLGLLGNSSQHIVVGWGHQGSGANSPQATVHTVTGITNGGGCVPPSGLALTPSATGGHLAPGLYYYRVAAKNASGVTLPSLEIMCAIPPGSANEGSIALAWGAVPTATEYEVFGRSQGAELLIASTAETSYTDTGSITPSGALPVSNTTGTNDVITLGNAANLLAHAANTAIYVTSAANLYYKEGFLRSDFSLNVASLVINTSNIQFSATNGGSYLRAPYQSTGTVSTPPASNSALYVPNASGEWAWKGPDGFEHKISSVPLEEVLLTGLGFKSWAFDYGLTSGGTAPTAGTIYVRALSLRAGQKLGFVDWLVNTQGVGTSTLTHIYTGYCNSAGKMLAQSADLKESTIWTAATGIAKAPLSAEWTVPADGLYYAVFLQVGSWQTTQMALSKGVSNAAPSGIGTTVFGTAGTAQTALPANESSLTIATTNGVNYWTGAS